MSDKINPLLTAFDAGHDAGFHAGWEAAIDEAAILLESDEDRLAIDAAPFIRALAERSEPANSARTEAAAAGEVPSSIALGSPDQTLDAVEGASLSWPAGCHDKNSCARRRTCMYHGCRHASRSIVAEVEAAIKREHRLAYRLDGTQRWQP